MSTTHRRWIQLWLAAIAATIFLVLLIGGITRLTHSGLSIVDWRPLMGVVPPLTEAEWLDSFNRYQQFPEYQQLRPSMTLAEYKGIFFWEYLHRLLARLIGVVFIIPFAYFYFSGALTRPLVRRTLTLLALGALQGIAGWLMVASGLVDRPSVSHYRLAIHLMLALTTFSLCIWLIRDLSRSGAVAMRRTPSALALDVVGVLLGLQIVFGAFVAGLKAGLAFNTFPLMGGAIVPIEYWTLRPLVLNLVQHPAGVQWMHRLIGTVLVIATCILYQRVRRTAMDSATHRLTAALCGAIAIQYALGVLTLLYLVPAGLALAHQAMAVAIVGLWVSLRHRDKFGA